MPKLFEDPILSAIEGAQSVAWVGIYPPDVSFYAINCPVDHNSCFRSHPQHNQRYDLVFFVEHDVGSRKNWKLSLDDALRFIAPGGTLVLRFSETAFMSVFALKNFLQQWTSGLIEIVDESRTSDGMFTVAFRLLHEKPRSANFDGWTFGLITDGRRPENVAMFINSVREIRGIQDYEILICGPEPEGFLPDGVVRYLTPPTAFQKEGWITKKKNILVKASRFENILVAHDRYSIARDFLETLSIFGGDFDVITPRQETFSGARFPDWVTLGADWNWTPSGLMEPHDDSPYTYINGGLIVAKTRILLETPWNELLFWNQAEDVELSRMLSAKGRVHRYAPQVVVKTLETRPGYIESFIEIPFRLDKFILPYRPSSLASLYYDGANLLPVGETGWRKILLFVSRFAVAIGVRPLLKVAYKLLLPYSGSLKSALSAYSPRLANKARSVARLFKENLKT